MLFYGVDLDASCEIFVSVNRGIRVNINKTKVMISGEWQKAVRWPCGVSGRAIGNNSIQCTSCQKCIHRKCSGIQVSMYKMMKTFVCTCRGCLNPLTVQDAQV